jgi:hypothetical protein
MVIKKFRKIWFIASVSSSVRLENKIETVVGARARVNLNPSGDKKFRVVGCVVKLMLSPYTLFM